MKVPSNLVKDIRKYYSEQLCSIYEKEEANALIMTLFDFFFKIDRVKMALEPDLRLSESEMLRFHFAVKDLLKHKPIQYVLGETEFRGLKFKVDEGVLIPRPETSEMVDMIVKNHLQSEELDIIDLCTGSGCIAISLSKMLPDSKVMALDISEKAVEMAKINARNNGVEVHFILDDILSLKNPISEKFDIIVSNPPYVKKLERKDMRNNVLLWEPYEALFVDDEDPLLFYREILDFSHKHLNKNGDIWFEINENEADGMIKLCKEKAFSDVRVYKDFRGKDRFVYVKNI